MKLRHEKRGCDNIEKETDVIRLDFNHLFSISVKLPFNELISNIKHLLKRTNVERFSSAQILIFSKSFCIYINTNEWEIAGNTSQNNI